jgi:hypothetical protein
MLAAKGRRHTPANQEQNMRQRFLCVIMLMVGLAGAMSVGCHKKTRTVERTESIETSEPQMVSPGKEKVVE